MTRGAPLPQDATADPPLPVSWTDLGRVSLRHVHLGRGRGLPLVLLHEMGGTLETWDRALPLLAEGHEVLAYDWRGFGQSEKIAGTVTVADHVADLAALLEALRIEGPVLIAGVAVGAAIACGFAAADPDRTAGLVLISPALEVPAADRAGRLASIAEFETGGMRAAVEASLAGGYPERFRAATSGRFEAFRARWLANDPESFAANYRMLLDLRIDPILARIRCPVRLVAGEFDPVRTPAHVATVAARIAGASQVTVPGGHHMPHQIPEILAETILDFAATLPARGAH
jgi:3-oxoadipate enol-lactonase